MGFDYFTIQSHVVQCTADRQSQGNLFVLVYMLDISAIFMIGELCMRIKCVLGTKSQRP